MENSFKLVKTSSQAVKDRFGETSLNSNIEESNKSSTHLERATKFSVVHTEINLNRRET